MARLYQCTGIVQAHMIRSFLLDHDIETHVVHEFAGTLWPASISGCALAIHETDLEFLPEALAVPREATTDEDAIDEAHPALVEQKAITEIPGFFAGLLCLGAVISLLLGLLILAFELLDWGIYGKANVSGFQSQYTFADVAWLIAWGFLGGFLASCAILAVRMCLSEDDGAMALEMRLLALVVFLMCSPVGTLALYLVEVYFGWPKAFF